MSVVGEMIASAVVKQITSRLIKFAIEEVTLQWKFKGEVDKMAEKMKDLAAVMHDADDRLRRGEKDGEAVGRWLTKLKSVAYDVEDVLDDLETQNSQAKSLSTDNETPQNGDCEEEIDELEKEHHALNLVVHEARAQGSRNSETFAASNETGMVGRNTEKGNIINLLLGSEANEDISIIPIVGLGGIGKTTLARSVFTDEKVKFFSIRVWVHVSKEFDLQKIGCAIMKSLDSSISLENCTLQFLHDNMKKRLATTRYLIVLDDLWEENGEKLEELKWMLQHGTKGSRIIVTTRNVRVVKTLCTGFLANIRKVCPVADSAQINLSVLSSDDCWELMKQKAFGPHDDQGGLEEIGMEIAHKCGGLPLVVNALGKVLSESRNTEAWKHIRDTKVDLGLRDVDQKKTLECLMLSYYYMQPDYKMCFSYLAAFPKGFVINSVCLIQQWNALGYIYTGYDGLSCIDYLLGMSFLQISESTAASPSLVHGKASREVTMHDLVHELVSIITAEEFLVLDATEQKKHGRSMHFRHAQVTKYKDQSNVFKHLPGKLRSLHFRNAQEMQLSENAFSRFKYIRVLDLSSHKKSGCSVMPSFSLAELKLLRYLDVTGLPIVSLPKSLHTLHNIQTLIMSNCSLEALPDNMCRLHELCYLDLSGNSSLNKLPVSLAGLSRLKFLNLSGCSKLTKLPDNVPLESLEHLDISNCHELQNLPNDIGSLQNLRFFNLANCYKVPMLPESFCQLKKLKGLDLSDCQGLKYLPDCFGTLSELESLKLTSCSKLHLLPESFCKLSKLRNLDLSYCVMLERIPSSFAKLELQALNISNTTGLSRLPYTMIDMTTLTNFVFLSCTALVSSQAKYIVDSSNLPGRHVHIIPEVCNTGFNNDVQLAQLAFHDLKIGGLENIVSAEGAERVKLHEKSGLLQLGLFWSKMNDFSLQCKYVLEKLLPPRTLEQLTLSRYPSKDFPSWVHDISFHLPSLTCIRLHALETCDTLPPFGQLPNLRSLYMDSIPNIRKVGKEFYGEGGACIKLRLISLVSMENLAEWWTTQSSDENEEFLIPDLQELVLVDCPKLKFLPYAPRSMLWYLSNTDDALTEQGSRNISSSNYLYFMRIAKCSFSPDKWHSLRHLVTIEIFVVASCSGLRALPKTILCFTSLKTLKLSFLKDLETLPEWLGQLTSLEEIQFIDCLKLTFLPESMKNLNALKELWVKRCKSLVKLPNELGCATSLERVDIKCCRKLTCLPESIKNLPALRSLSMVDCKGLAMPEWLDQLTSLDKLSFSNGPTWTSPKNMHSLTNLKRIYFACSDMTILPEWLGQLVFLEELHIDDCPELTSVPESICNHTILKEIIISETCPSLIEWCKGKGAGKINACVSVVKVSTPWKFDEVDQEEEEEKEEEEEVPAVTNWTKLFVIVILCFMFLLSFLACMYNPEPMKSVGRRGRTKTSGRPPRRSATQRRSKRPTQRDEF